MARYFALVLLPTLFVGAAEGIEHDSRCHWCFRQGQRYFKETRHGHWAEFENGRELRCFDEIRRTSRYVELSTAQPCPAIIRLENRCVRWRLREELTWRTGKPGGWEAVAVRDTRSNWHFEGKDRFLRRVGNERWAEFDCGKCLRHLNELDRTANYVELTTRKPAPAIIRVYSDHVLWRLTRERQWREGSLGHWEPTRRR